jgi:hypothetical protein
VARCGARRDPDLAAYWELYLEMNWHNKYCLAFAVLGGACTSPTGQSVPSDGGNAQSISLYTWTETWGPCVPSIFPCKEQFTAAPTGALTHLLHGDSKDAVLGAADLVKFNQFTADPRLLMAVSDPHPCPLIGDRTESVLLTFANGSPEVSKNVLGCVGDIYDAIRNWNTTFASYFPETSAEPPSDGATGAGD